MPLYRMQQTSSPLVSY